jgi:hypothetical protein
VFYKLGNLRIYLIDAILFQSDSILASGSRTKPSSR